MKPIFPRGGEITAGFPDGTTEIHPVSAGCGLKHFKPQQPTESEKQMPRPKPQDLPAMDGPGVEGPAKFPDIEKAADKYIDIRDTRMTWTEKEVGAKAVLVEKMNAHNLSIYRFGDHQVEVSAGKLKVKVKNIGQDGEVEDNDD